MHWIATDRPIAQFYMESEAMAGFHQHMAGENTLSMPINQFNANILNQSLSQACSKGLTKGRLCIT